MKNLFQQDSSMNCPFLGTPIYRNPHSGFSLPPFGRTVKPRSRRTSYTRLLPWQGLEGAAGLPKAATER